jgi:hypothetical protein
MYKIFKYDLLIGGEGQDQYFYANCPSGRVIRTDYVDDGYYKGNFVWIIVDPEDKNIQPRRIEWINNTPIKAGNNIQIGVLEKQVVYIPVGSTINSIYDSEGMFWLGYTEPKTSLGLQRVVIKGYKTGQEILDNVDNLEYIGWCKLWIKQELAVYFFKVK